MFEGRQPAKLLVDSTSNPAVALLLRPPRHAFLAGDLSCEAVWHYMADLSPRKLFARDQLILSMPNDSWRYPIMSVLGEGLTEESRVSFGFTALPAAALAAQEDLPVATRVTAKLLQHEMLDGVLRNWQTVEQFETRGLAYCILGPRGDVVSACYSVTSGEDIAPIQVMTASEHQRKGYATIVAVPSSRRRRSERSPLPGSVTSTTRPRLPWLKNWASSANQSTADSGTPREHPNRQIRSTRALQGLLPLRVTRPSRLWSSTDEAEVLMWPRRFVSS